LLGPGILEQRRPLKRLLPILPLLAVVGTVGLLTLWWSVRHENRFDGQIRAGATRYGLPPALVKAVVWRESRFNPEARGKAGEIGLMQITEDAAQEWADALRLTNYVHEHTLDPGTNVLAGTHYLAKVLRRYAATDNPAAYALADYNAGRGNVLRWMNSTNAPAARTNSAVFLSSMTFPGTRHYVQEILERRSHYESQFLGRP
jgi:soluble lytic murein transglycosylase